ncbi:glycosyltransferase [Candidatus Woesearchaeota archaeon]|nr:glycosyltransferase [Candidatus Woesearchaeota archaeon]
MITAGIPTYNEERVITKTIRSVLEQLGKKDELIVVASGCTDNTIPEIKKIKDKRIRLFIEEEREGKSSALNLIIKHAKADIIVQTDGDVELEKDAIKKLLPHFKDKNIGAVSGQPVPIIPRSNMFYDWTMMSYRKASKLREQESKEGTLWHLSGYLIAFRKQALQRVPFAKGAVDAWMGKIIHDNGYQMKYEPNAIVYVKAPLTVSDFIKQKARVRAGFYMLPKPPRKVQKEIFWLPKEMLKIPMERWPEFIFAGIIYAYSWVKGWYLVKTNASLQKIWKVPTSTK